MKNVHFWKIFTTEKYSPLKNIHPKKYSPLKNIHPWKIFTLKNIHSWKILTPEKYSPLKNIHPWEVKWLSTQTLNARMIYPCHLLLYPPPPPRHHLSSFVIFWLTPPLPLGWWRHLWTAPKTKAYIYVYVRVYCILYTAQMHRHGWIHGPNVFLIAPSQVAAS